MPSPKSIIQKKMRACEDLAARCANEQPSVTNQPALSIRPLSRRRFIGRIGGAAAAAWTASAISLSPVLGSKSVKAEAATILGRQRAIEAYDLRKDAALAEYHLPIVSHPNNGDEDLLGTIPRACHTTILARWTWPLTTAISRQSGAACHPISRASFSAAT